MRLPLTPAEQELYQGCQAFAASHIAPFAGEWDEREAIATSVLPELAGRGYLGLNVAAEYGGGQASSLAYGLLHEAVGAACSSVRSLLTVHGMVCHAVGRWGSASQRADWLPLLAGGRKLGAFALSEPNAGSDAGAIELAAAQEGDSYVLQGCKQWITFGQLADVFLVFGQTAQGAAVFLVERDSAGLSVQAMHGMVGTRAAMMAHLKFDNVRVPAAAMLGRPGFGLSHVLASTLDWGRFSVAWGSVGIQQACVRTVLAHVRRRHAFGAALSSQQLVQAHLTGMVSRLNSSRLLCYQAAYARDRKDVHHMSDTMLAKYQAARDAAESAHMAVQLLGARGCSRAAPAERFWRDAKVMEIIEGSSEVLQVQIARQVFEGYAVPMTGDLP
jgi:alkylation response protein AidB-like acyl-CoA dehydrogenase